MPVRIRSCLVKAKWRLKYQTPYESPVSIRGEVQILIFENKKIFLYYIHIIHKEDFIDD